MAGGGLYASLYASSHGSFDDAGDLVDLQSSTGSETHLITADRHDNMLVYVVWPTLACIVLLCVFADAERRRRLSIRDKLRRCVGRRLVEADLRQRRAEPGPRWWR